MTLFVVNAVVGVVHPVQQVAIQNTVPIRCSLIVMIAVIYHQLITVLLINKYC
jgi:hypothetical protein